MRQRTGAIPWMRLFRPACLRKLMAGFPNRAFGNDLRRMCCFDRAVFLFCLRDFCMCCGLGGKPSFACNSLSRALGFFENAFTFDGRNGLIIELQLGSLLFGLFLIHSLLLLIMLGICRLASMGATFGTDRAFSKP